MFASSDLYQIAPSEYQRQTAQLDNLSYEQQIYNQDAFKKAVFQRLFSITVPGRSKEAVMGFIGKLQAVLEGIQLQNAGEMFMDCMLDHVNVVGQYQKDVAIAGPRELHGDIVVALASMPTVNSVQALGAKVVVDLVKNYQGEEFQYAFIDNHLKVSSSQVVVMIHITAPEFMSGEMDGEANSDTSSLIPTEVLEDNQRLVDEAEWFAVNASTTSIKGLVRLMADLRERFTSFSILKDPALDLLAHYCIMDAYEGIPLPIEVAFRRFLEFLSMGVLMRDTYPASDIFPTEVDSAAKKDITAQATDLLCSIAQGDYAKVFSS